jgi:hypothetical protein
MNYKVLVASALTASVVVLAGCQKDRTLGGDGIQVERKVTLTETQKREASEMVQRVPTLRFYDEAENRFIDFKVGSRDFVFSDPDEGFSFDDPDQNGVILWADGDVDYIVFSTGIGTAGNGGGGTVVAGNTALNMDLTVCLSVEEVASGDGYGDLFDTGFGFNEYGAVFGIAGDFEALAGADWEADDFDPFEFFHGYAAYYVITDGELEGNHEVFDWLDTSDDGSGDYDDMASSFVMDFSNFALYFATSGSVNVSGGSMTFNGEYLAIEDLFLDFLEENEEDPEVNIVSGFGTMGCN